MELESYIKKLDMLSWGFRIEKMQERGGCTEWCIMYVNPKTKMWYSAQSEDMKSALKEAVDRLEQDGVKEIYSTKGLYNTDGIE